VAEWSFLTNHARVLLCIAHDPGVRLRDVAATLGLTERRAYGIVTDLTEAGYVVKEKDGRRRRYQIQAHLPLREVVGRDHTMGEVLDRLVTRTLADEDDKARVTLEGSTGAYRSELGGTSPVLSLRLSKWTLTPSPPRGTAFGWSEGTWAFPELQHLAVASDACRGGDRHVGHLPELRQCRGWSGGELARWLAVGRGRAHVLRFPEGRRGRLP
jgi:DNA-binding MarR family transcriptional regulator